MTPTSLYFLALVGVFALLPLTSAVCGPAFCVTTASESIGTETFSFHYDATGSNDICGLVGASGQIGGVSFPPFPPLPPPAPAFTLLSKNAFLQETMTPFTKITDRNLFVTPGGATPASITLSIGVSSTDQSGNPVTIIIDGTGAPCPVTNPPSTCSDFQIAVKSGSTQTTVVEDLQSLTLSPGVCVASGSGDPVFKGFHGQRFVVEGEAGRVFNILSTPSVQFNARFVELASHNESMTREEMKIVRMRHSRLISDIKAQAAESITPLRTTAWSHPGKYMGECGIKLGGERLAVVAGPYADGFASVTLNGVAVPVSASPVEIQGSTYAVARFSPYTVDIVTPEVSVSIVNADHFFNIASAVLATPPPEVSTISGLLGQTADPTWTAKMKSSEFVRHIEHDFMLASNDVFADDFPTNKFVQ